MVCFFSKRLERGESSVRFWGLNLDIPGVNGDVTFVKRLAVAAGISARHENTEKMTITPRQVVESLTHYMTKLFV